MNIGKEVKVRMNIYLKHIGIDVDMIGGRCVVSPILDNDGIEVKRCPELNNKWVNTGKGEMLLPEKENSTWSYFRYNRPDGAVELSFGTEEIMREEAECVKLRIEACRLRSEQERLESKIKERDKIMVALLIKRDELERHSPGS